MFVRFYCHAVITYCVVFSYQAERTKEAGPFLQYLTYKNHYNIQNTQ